MQVHGSLIHCMLEHQTVGKRKPYLLQRGKEWKSTEKKRIKRKKSQCLKPLHQGEEKIRGGTTN